MFEGQFEKQIEQELTREEKIAQAGEEFINAKLKEEKEVLSEEEFRFLEAVYRMNIFERNF